MRLQGAQRVVEAQPGYCTKRTEPTATWRRGEGYRRALEISKAEAHDLLIQCIARDPRLDSQVEQGYFLRGSIRDA